MKGYTLIEIMVSLTIIGIIFGAGFIAFREFSRRQALTSAVRGLMGDLRLAQTEALAGSKPDDAKCQGTSTLDGYYFRVVPPNRYEILAKCVGGEVLIKSVTLTQGVTITPPNQNPILFKILGLGTNIMANDAMVVDVFGQSQIIAITQSGSIE